MWGNSPCATHGAITSSVAPSRPTPIWPSDRGGSDQRVRIQATIFWTMVISSIGELYPQWRARHYRLSTGPQPSRRTSAAPEVMSMTVVGSKPQLPPSITRSIRPL